MPATKQYGTWPLSGEIELVRVNGNRHINCSNLLSGIKVASSNLQWGLSRDSLAISPFYVQLQDDKNDASSQFHVYRMNWTADGISFFFDGHFVGSLKPPPQGLWKMVLDDEKSGINPWKQGSKMAPFDQPVSLMLTKR